MNRYHVAAAILYLLSACVVAFGLWALCFFVMVGLS